MSTHPSPSSGGSASTGNAVPGAFLVSQNTVRRALPFRFKIVAAENQTVVPLAPSTSLSAEDREEQEWEEIVRKPHVRNALERMAAEALRQRAAGETVEGGFGLE